MRTVIKRRIAMNDPSTDLTPYPADIVRASNAAILSVGPDRRIRSWNPAAERLFGYTSDEALGSDLSIVTPKDRIDEALGLHARIMSGERFSVETVRRHKTGRLVDVFVALAPIRDVDGRILGACAVTHDITENRATERKLQKEAAAATAAARETAQRFETLIQNSPLAIVTLDRDARVLLWNPAAEQLFGWSEADVLGRFTRILPEENRRHYEAELRAALCSPESLHWETKRQRRDGSVLDVIVWLAPLFNDQHEIFASMALFMDVTERRFLERALLEATERESRRIGQELHDHLCQHLLGAAFSIKAVASSQPADSPTAAKLNDLARLINSAVVQARDIARGLNPVELDSAGLMAALQELTERPHAGVTCRLECQRPVLLPDAEAALHAYRIAQEAVANAVKHSGGTEIVVRLTEDAQHVYLQIVDNGSGILRQTVAPQGKIGLELMKYRAHAVGGNVAIHTTMEGGTGVTCSIPKRR